MSADEKAGWCSTCRAENHSLCSSGPCACPSKGRRNHALRPKNKSVTQPTPTRPDISKPAPAVAKATPPPTPPTPTPSSNGANSILRLSLEDAALDLLVRALRFTVGEADGGTDIESFDSAERAEMLRLSETFDGARS